VKGVDMNGYRGMMNLQKYVLSASLHIGIGKDKDHKMDAKELKLRRGRRLSRSYSL
jgi:hypothetical protein